MVLMMIFVRKQGSHHVVGDGDDEELFDQMKIFFDNYGNDDNIGDNDAADNDISDNDGDGDDTYL